MKKELQNYVWQNCLPKEFKEVVKAHYAGLNAAYKAYLSKDSLSNEECDRCTVLREKMALYQMYFGYYNLTSDAEGEEMLTVPRSKVQGLYDLACEIHADGTKDWYQGYMKAMQDLFGSKCLLDEAAHEDNFTSKSPKPAKPKFRIGDKVKDISSPHDDGIYKVDDIKRSSDGFIYHIQGLIGISNVKESDLEPYTSQDPIPLKSGGLKPQTAETQTKQERTEPTCTDDCPSQHFDNIISRDFADHNRLHIAAMAMAGLLANQAVYKDSYKINPADTDPMNAHELIAKTALAYADQLIKHAKKGEPRK